MCKTKYFTIYDVYAKININMDHEKSHTTNPLMLKKQMKEAEPSSHFSSFSQNDSAMNDSVYDEFTPDTFNLDNNLPDSPDTIDQLHQIQSHKSARQFNLRPSTNPVSDFRRRRGYKGAANPSNTLHRPIPTETHAEPLLRSPVISSPEPVITRPAPTRRPSNNTTPELDIEEIQNLSISVIDNDTPDNNATLQNDATKSKKKAKKSHKKPLMIIGGLLMMVSVAAIVALVLLKIFPSHTSNSSTDNVSANNTNASVKESDDPMANSKSFDDDTATPSRPSDTATSTELIDGVVEVSIIGLADSVTPGLDHRIVKVSVSNTSDVAQSAKVSLSALDESGKILGVSSLHSEAINPGDTLELEAFVSTSLTADQLENASFKIRSASTHQAVTTPPEEGRSRW